MATDPDTVFRPPAADEVRMLRAAAAAAADFAFPDRWLEQVRVRPLRDGGMGSLRLRTPSTPPEAGRIFGRPLGECRFTDRDGVEVLVTLTADRAGHVYELDVWKVDYTPTLHVPADSGFH